MGNSVIGKITRNRKGILDRKNYVLVTDNEKASRWRYAGLITGHPVPKSIAGNKMSAIQIADKSDLLELNENDVVILDTTGEINVIWEEDSTNNAIFVTERCNCRCLTCPQPPSNEDRGQFELILRLLELIDPSKTYQIGITGGEPTLIGDRFFKLIELCRDKFPNTTVSLLTNGRKFSQFEFTKRFAEINHPNVTICVSSNSDTDTEHDHIMGAKHSFKEAVEGIHNLALYRQRVEVRTVIQALNYQRLPQLAEYIYRNLPFVFHVALMGMEVCGLAAENIDQLWIDPVEYQSFLRDAVLQLHRQMMNVSIYNIPLCLLPKEVRAFSRQSISSWKNIYLPACEDCSVQKQCCGLFSTSGEWQSKNISPVPLG